MLKNSFQFVSRQAVRMLLLCLAFVMVSILFAGSDVEAQEGVSDTTQTPYQRAIEAAVNGRRASGLPVPQVTTSTIFMAGSPGNAFRRDDITTGQEDVTTIIGTTVIEFDNPQQAGYAQWPDLVVVDNLPEDMGGNVEEGNYTEAYSEFLEEEIPTIWEEYTLGQEPRTYTYVETITVPNQSIQESLQNAVQAAAISNSENVLIGFTYQGPDLPYFIEESFTVLGVEAAYFKAGFDLSWAAGLRLPGNVELAGPDVMELGQSYDFESTMNTSNWSATQYSDTGVAPESGNEFVFRANFFVGIEGHIAGVDICPSCNVQVDVEESASFETPLGAGASFPIPSVDIPIYELDLAIFFFSVGFELDPNIGSDELRAHWRAVPGTDAQGSGTLVYTTDGGTVVFGQVEACDLAPGNTAQVEVHDFEYAFTIFEIDLNASITFELFGFGGEVANPTLFTLDLSSISGGVFLPDHVQCDALFNCSRAGPDNSIVLTIPVVDTTPPVTMISPSGTLGNNGWYVSDVTVTLSADDDCGNGVDFTEYSFDGVTWQTYTGPFVISDEGLTTVFYRSVDEDGNVEMTQSLEIRIDKTPPEITCYPDPPANAFGWNNTDVTVIWEATDAVSGIEFVSPPVVVSTEGENQSRSGFARDVAGNEAECEVTGINIDKTPPDIVINEPQPITYQNTDSFTVDWLVTDALSGVQSETGLLDGNPVSNGELVQLLLVAAGPHTFTVEALDFADNFNSASVDFFVDIDIDGLIASVNFMCDLGLINHQGICNALLAKLNAAKAAIDRGQNHTACNILNAFSNQVSAQRGNAIEDGAAGVLLINADFVCDNLPDAEVAVEVEAPPTEEPVVDNPVVGDGNGQANGNANGGGQGNGQANGNANGGQGTGSTNTNANGGGQGNGNANGGGQGNGQANGNANGGGN